MSLRLALIAISALACATPARVPEAAAPAAHARVDGPSARQLVAGGATLVDVRTPGLFQAGHIAGAINIPLAEIEQRAPAEIGPKTTPVVVYCRTGATSAKAAATLDRLGYLHVYDLGSYLNWGEGAPAPTPLPGTAASDVCPAPPR